MSDKYDPLQVLSACFALSSVAGIASELRNKGAVNFRRILSAALYSGTLGLVIGLLWYQYWSETDAYFLVGVSGLAGFGGISLVDIIISGAKKIYTGGLKIRFEVDDKGEE